MLDDMYCGPLAVEFQHLMTLEEREWFAQRFEDVQQEVISNEEKASFAKLMLQSQAFDHFVAAKFTTVKRYGGEGAESAMCFYDELFRLAANYGIEDVVTCIAHRGRLNLMTCLLDFPPVVMFRKMKGKREFPEDVVGAGDVLSHLTSSVDLDYDGKSVHVTMVPNPSHLEAVNPVAVGKTRGRQQSQRSGDYVADGEEGCPGDRALCFQIHGDAAFAGQGIVPETFALADVPHFTVGGSVHLIINNQLGFTTTSDRARSSEYSSCIAKMNACPVIHVNGDYPEEVAKACRLAMDYRQKYHKDVVVDLLCFRKWGHNELDDPSFTQPLMYTAIKSRASIPDQYAHTVVSEGACTEKSLNESVSSWTAELGENLAQVDSHTPKANHLGKQWAGLVQAPSVLSRWDTGVSLDLLKFVGAKSIEVPEDMKVHPLLRRTHLQRRLQKMEEGGDLDWATAESLAMGSLLYQGYNVRVSGQDVGRGTFSHRHVMLVDQETDAGYVPFNHMIPEQKGFLEIANSLLSEEAVLAFEYGISVENPNSLVIWEAQFGDFFNGAQIIIDTFITGGESKWLLQSGLVMLLPHGIDGAGPEHSSCRMERFLQCADSKEDGIDGDDVNIQFVNPTTPAQYFHLLRRQMVRNFRKPLIIAAPKVILRLPAASSTLADLAPGRTFQPVLDDPIIDPSKVNKVIFVCGKHYYNLSKEREARAITDVAIIRIEELCPFPVQDIQEAVKRYTNAKDFIWSQEEHRNSGAWSFISPRFENLLGLKLQYRGRVVHPTPATGVAEFHQQEAKKIIDDSFA